MIKMAQITSATTRSWELLRFQELKSGCKWSTVITSPKSKFQIGNKERSVESLLSFSQFVFILFCM